MSKRNKIVQIMPARPGWKALYLASSAMSEEERNGAPPETVSHAIECLALIAYDDGSTSVVAMHKGSWDSAHFSLVDDDDSLFVMLDRPDDEHDHLEPDELEQEARKVRQWLEKDRQEARNRRRK